MNETFWHLRSRLVTGPGVVTPQPHAPCRSNIFDSWLGEQIKAEKKEITGYSYPRRIDPPRLPDSPLLTPGEMAVPNRNE